ncbi:hypothetical protein [Ornithinibacillus scapharcae]|uniref:hypothetical protein n=1 Tax=Ornithinibacillus scapharcae TaxID=1147159 RepID=UPI000225B00B|nr:hypothetical protein [Ornithinibacillus scapharcae]
MTKLSPEEKREIVREELHQLVQSKYISLNIAAKVVNAHTKFYIDQPKENTVSQEKESPQQPVVEQQGNVNEEKVEESLIQDEIMPSVNEPKPQKFTKPVLEPKKLSAKEVRDRNITWGLNLGIILLLIGGLVLATSYWDTYGDLTKTGFITAVAVVFYGLAWLTGRILQIDKTAFAFLVLGSLYLPIVVISAGYFGIFGDFLSFSGEGKYLFGAIGTFVLIPIYYYSATKLQSRLFVWFSYISISVFVGLVIAAMQLPVDGFYLGIMFYNMLLILGYRKLKNHVNLKQFIAEFIPFIQANLILSTLLMLVFYDHEIIYSFNLLLTAIFYFSMIYVTNHKSYHFVFTGMIIYGSYQLVENSILEGVGEIVYALLGIFFLALPKVIKDTGSLKKIFQITSAIVSTLAFLYISLQGLVLRMGEGSIVLLIAYLLITFNFAYLASTAKNKLFNYLSPIFLMSSAYQLALLAKTWMGYESTILPFFVLAFLLYTVGGCLVKVSLWIPMKESTRDITGITMLISIFFGSIHTGAMELSVMLVLLSIIGIVMYHYETRPEMSPIAPWMHALALGAAGMILYQHFFMDMNLFYEVSFSPIQIVLGGLLVLFISYGWKSVKRNTFFIISFYVAQLFYGLGILNSLGLGEDSLSRMLICIGGIVMAYLLYRQTKWFFVPFVLSSMTLISYLSLLVVIYEQVSVVPEWFQWVQFVLASILLLLLGLLLGKKEQSLSRAFYWVGYIFLPQALLVSLVVAWGDGLWAFLIAATVYGITIKLVKTEWQVKTFLYAGTTALWVFVFLTFSKLDWYTHLSYSFFLISLLLFIGWLVGSDVWKKRILYYFVPFSSIGMLSFMLQYPYDLLTFVSTIVYGVLVLAVLKRMNWDIITILPLLLMYGGVMNFSGNDHVIEYQLLLHALFGLVLSVVGLLIYPLLYQVKEKFITLDCFTILGILVFLNLYQIGSGSLLDSLLPGILIVLFVFLNRKRVSDVPVKWMTFIAFVYVLQPYYVLLEHFELPALFTRELYVLPWVVVAVVLRRYGLTDNKSLANNIQWSVLVIVALLLVQDGLASNTIYDAIIVGILSLASLIAGMVKHVKSFFFVGAGVLLFNVFMQTRPYWGHLPWWSYLIIAGSLLLAIASYNEWQRKNNTEGKETLVKKFGRIVIERIKKWD